MAAYYAANPTTSSKDIQIIRRAIAAMPEPLVGAVRMLENNPHVNARVDTIPGTFEPDPKSKYIWISRKGDAFRSKDPYRIAGTLLHENEHLKGADEITARERQLEFLKAAIAAGQTKQDRRYMRTLEDFLKAHKRR